MGISYYLGLCYEILGNRARSSPRFRPRHQWAIGLRSSSAHACDLSIPTWITWITPIIMIAESGPALLSAVCRNNGMSILFDESRAAIGSRRAPPFPAHRAPYTSGNDDPRIGIHRLRGLRWKLCDPDRLCYTTGYSPAIHRFRRRLFQHALEEYLPTCETTCARGMTWSRARSNGPIPNSPDGDRYRCRVAYHERNVVVGGLVGRINSRISIQPGGHIYDRQRMQYWYQARLKRGIGPS